jgi:hypothetical protein
MQGHARGVRTDRNDARPTDGFGGGQQYAFNVGQPVVARR